MNLGIKTMIVRIYLLLIFLSFGCKAVDKKDALLSFKDEITINNGIVRVGVAPSVGRIVTFGRVGGINILWRNLDKQIPRYKSKKRRWLNYGGDKLWPNSQKVWEKLQGADWPPDEFLDGSKWKVLSKSKNRIVIQSPVSPYSHVSFTREISLVPGKAVVRIKNTLKQHLYTAYPVYIWSITQAIMPEYCLLGVASDQSKSANLWVRLGKNKANVTKVSGGRAIRLNREGEKSFKIGTNGRWIAAVYPKNIFLQCTEYSPNGNYPERCSIKCFVAHLEKKDSYWKNGKPVFSHNFIEIEPLGKATHLKTGERIENVVFWKLINRPEETSEDKLAILLDIESNKLLK